MSEQQWSTGITKIEPNKVLLRGYPIDQLMGKASFAQAVYLALVGELPPPNAERLVEAILVSSIDHGVTPPSCQTARNIASTGSPLNAAVAGGVLAISRHHGGAIEDSMIFFIEAVKRKEEAGWDSAKTAEHVVETYRGQQKRIPGFGHRIHTRDPRTAKLFQIAGEQGLAGPYVQMALDVQAANEKLSGRNLPINVDGAIAALLCEMGFDPGLANAFFMMARVPGLIAHVREEQTRMRPMRQIIAREHVYDGPPEREWPKK
ncbi:MAG: citryl-CoA lyase [Deltaproteobacteria bacterium]|nr:citryl-CoA lyase [Deltaproteobacteria bacterium]